MSDTNIYTIVIMVGVVLLSLPLRSALETSGEVKTNCPAYVREGFELSCDCFVSNKYFSANISWNVPGSGSQLKVQQVRRKDNGTTYTCNGEWGSRPSRDSLNYTLHVAFGPDSVKMSSNATEPLVTNGTVQVALYCHADDVYPAANYTWTGVTCVNKDHTRGTCIFTPRVPEDDDRLVSCTAQHAIFTRLTKSTDSKLTLTYPPMSPPEITRDIGTLTCRVKGGDPKVSSVNFFCGNQPDTPDVVDDVSVSSSVVIDVHQPHSNMTCECSATWAPQPGMYPHRVVIPLYLFDSGSPSSQEDKNQLPALVGVGSACVVLVLIIIVVIACFIKRKRSRKYSFL